MLVIFMLQVIITINNKMYMLMYHASLHKLTHFQNNLKNEIYKFFPAPYQFIFVLLIFLW